jgi:hypothetical protein
MAHRNRKSLKVTPTPDPQALVANSPEYTTATPEDYVMTDRGREVPHNSSPTAIAAEAMRSGLFPPKREEEIPGEDNRLRSGDPDVDPLRNEYVGEEMPGGSMPTPDQNNVDEVGRLYGVNELDSGALRAAEELLERRDARGWASEQKERTP